MPNRVRERRLWTGRASVMATGHRSASFGGAQTLSNANGAGALSPMGGFNISASCWVKFDTIVAATYYKSFHMGAGAVGTDVLGLQLDGSTGKIASFSSNGSVYSTIQSIVPAVGNWYFCFATWGGAANALDVYDLNGLLFSGSTGSSGVQVVNQPLQVGSGPAAARFFMTGEVDSLMWWPKSTAISSMTLWNNGKALDVIGLPDRINLAAFWQMDAMTGAPIWTDDSGGGNPLTATGTVVSASGAGY